MSYSTGPKRLVRNPITGEELVYERGQRPVTKSNLVDPSTDHDERVRQILANSKTGHPHSTTNTYSQTSQPAKSEFMSHAPYHTNNTSVAETRGTSSIPMLNFSELASEDRMSATAAAANDATNSQKINYKQELANLVEKQAVLAEFKNLNPLVHPALVDNSARPKSSYGLASEQLRPLDSPIMRLQLHQKEQQKQKQQQQQAVSPLVSQIEAPRDNANAAPFADLAAMAKPLSEKKKSVYRIERVADLEKLWLESGGAGNVTPAPDERRADNDEKARFLKQQLVVDTILTDQLSKLPMGSARGSADLKTIYTARGNRHTIIDNHLRPVNSLSENTLAKKCKFACRLRTPNGKHALRELFGLLFLYDNSLTIYEYRVLCGGVSSNIGAGGKTTALPFVARRLHHHAFGRRKGQPVQIWDIHRGAVLHLAADSSDTARQTDHLAIEVIDVDEVEKEAVLTGLELAQSGALSHEMVRGAHDVKQRLAQPYTAIELNDRKILASIRLFVRQQIEQRSVEVYMGVSRSLRARGGNNGGLISVEDLHDALVEFSVQMHSEDVRIAWQVLDLDGVGALSYYVVMRAVFGEMGAARHAQFRHLMRKLDAHKTGYVQTSDVYKYYRVARHPRVRSGDVKEDEFKATFLSAFEVVSPTRVPEYVNASGDGKTPIIAYEQFEEYYNGLSIVVDTDEDFMKILKNSWNLV